MAIRRPALPLQQSAFERSSWKVREEAIRYCGVLALSSLRYTSSTASCFLGKHVIQTGKNLLENEDFSKDDYLICVR